MCRLGYRRNRRAQTPRPLLGAPQPALPGSNGEAPALGLDPRGGSGPARLALAILPDHLDDDRAALNLYQRFKWACIAQIHGASWSLSSEEIDNCLVQLSEQRENTEFPTGGPTQ